MPGQEPSRDPTGEPEGGDATGNSLGYDLQTLRRKLMGLVGKNHGHGHENNSPPKNEERKVQELSAHGVQEETRRTIEVASHPDVTSPNTMVASRLGINTDKQPGRQTPNAKNAPLVKSQEALRDQDLSESTKTPTLAYSHGQFVENTMLNMHKPSLEGQSHFIAPHSSGISSSMTHGYVYRRPMNSTGTLASSQDLLAVQNSSNFADLQAPGMHIAQARFANASGGMQAAGSEASIFPASGLPFPRQLESEHGLSNVQSQHWVERGVPRQFQQHASSNGWGPANTGLNDFPPAFQGSGSAQEHDYQENIQPVLNSSNPNLYTRHGQVHHLDGSSASPGNPYYQEGMAEPFNTSLGLTPHEHINGSPAPYPPYMNRQFHNEYAQAAKHDHGYYVSRQSRHSNMDPQLGAPYRQDSDAASRPELSNQIMQDGQKSGNVSVAQAMIPYTSRTSQSAGSHETGSLSPGSSRFLLSIHGPDLEPSAFPVRFTNLDNARNSWQQSIKVLSHNSDRSFPQSGTHQVQYVQNIMAALHAIHDAKDNVPMIDQWVKQRQGMHSMEDQAWKILARCIDAHQQAEPLVRGGKPTKRYCSFQERVLDIIKSLRNAKTICKHLMAPHYIDSFVDDPIGSANRVANNRKVNQGKKSAIESGRLAIQYWRNGQPIPHDLVAAHPSQHDGEPIHYDLGEDESISSPERKPKSSRAAGKRASKKRKADDSNDSDTSFRLRPKKRQAPRKKRESKYPMVQNDTGAFVIRARESSQPGSAYQPKHPGSRDFPQPVPNSHILRSNSHAADWQQGQDGAGEYGHNSTSLDGSLGFPVQTNGYHRSVYLTHNIDPALSSDPASHSYFEESQQSTFNQSQDPRIVARNFAVANDSPDSNDISGSLDNDGASEPEGFKSLPQKRFRKRDPPGNQA